MPAPTNISFATAEDLGTLTVGVPVVVTAVADFGGTTYNLFYQFTAPAETNEIYAFAFGDLVTYKPKVQPYDHTEASVLSIGGSVNRPDQFPVTGGELYYLEVVRNGAAVSPANLTLTVVAHETQAVATGSFLIPDANDGFPAAILSGTTDYTVLRFLQPFSSSEQGDVLPTGESLIQTDVANIDTITLRDAAFNTIDVLNANNVCIRACLGQNVFYVAVDNGGANAIIVKTVTSDGTMTTVDTMTGITDVEAIAASNDGTKLYHATTGVSPAVKVWDLVNHVALADLAAGINSRIVDILVMDDDSILVSYVTGTFIVKRYDAAGTVLNTYTITASYSSVVPRLAYAIDTTSFWVWYAEPIGGGTGISHIQNIKLSDGSVLTDRLNMSYGAGIWTGADDATPPGTFGHDNSCPFWLVRGSQPTTQHFTIRRQRRWLAPTSESNFNMSVPTLEILMRNGIGLTPGDAADPPVLGSDPQVMYRFSKDGGKTWGPERWASAGTLGNYINRVRFLRATGNYRQGVFEITVSDPVDWQFLSAVAPQGVLEGSS